jgi:hypothetical protein
MEPDVPEMEIDPIPCQNQDCAGGREGRRAWFDGRTPARLGPEDGYFPPIEVCEDCYELLTGRPFVEPNDEDPPIVGESPF